MCYKFSMIQNRDTGYCAIWSLPTKDTPKGLFQEDVHCISIEALHDKAHLRVATKATSEQQRKYGLPSQRAFLNLEQCLNVYSQAAQFVCHFHSRAGTHKKVPQVTICLPSNFGKWYADGAIIISLILFIRGILQHILHFKQFIRHHLFACRESRSSGKWRNGQQIVHFEVYALLN